MPVSTKLLLSLSGLLGLFSIIVFLNSHNHTTLDKATTGFAVEDSASIARVLITPSGKKTITLSKDEFGHWMVNNKWKADKEYMSKLIYLLTRIQVRRPVASEIADSLNRLLNHNGVNIEVANENNKELVAFKALLYDRELIAVKENTKNLYFMSVPGEQDEIVQLVHFGAYDWRSRQLFSSDQGSLRGVKVEYAHLPEDNFEIKYLDGGFAVKGVLHPDTIKLVAYLSILKDVKAKRFLETASFKDSLQKLQPDYIFSVDDLSPECSGTVNIYYNRKTDKAYGLLYRDKETEAILLNKRIFNYLLQPKSFFVKGERKGAEARK